MQTVLDVAKFQEKGLDHSDILDALFAGTTATGEAAWAPSQGVLPNDSAGPCQEIPSNSKDNHFQNMEDIFVETPDLNDIGDAGISDIRPDHVVNTNDHARLRRKNGSNTANP